MNSARGGIIITVILSYMLAFGAAQAQSVDLIGPVSAEEIIANDRIYEIYVNRYSPDKEALSYLSAYPDSVSLLVFMGSWCKESKKYIPALMKTLQLSGSESIRVKYLGVDRQKKIPKSFLNEHGIKYIPTVLVLKGDKELGRIVEKPHQLIETDLVQILKTGIEKKD